MGDPDERPHPDGGVDDFDAIVAGWRDEGEVPQWPAAPEPAVPEPAVPEPAVPEPAVPEPAVPEPAVPEPAVPEPAVPEPTTPTAPAPAVATPPTPEDEHFVPPEPPPFPRLAPPAAVGLVLLVLGVVLVSAPGWVGVPGTYGLPLGLLTLAAGLGWLVLRLWPTPPGPGDDDDGAVL